MTKGTGMKNYCGGVQRRKEDDAAAAATARKWHPYSGGTMPGRGMLCPRYRSHFYDILDVPCPPMREPFDRRFAALYNYSVKKEEDSAPKKKIQFGPRVATKEYNSIKREVSDSGSDDDDDDEEEEVELSEAEEQEESEKFRRYTLLQLQADADDRAGSGSRAASVRRWRERLKI